MTTTLDTRTVTAAIDGLRRNMMAMVNKACDDLVATLAPAPQANGVTYKVPTLADGQDPGNKNGKNLTSRGAEILYRLFDDGAGYNRAGKTLGITQAAAKNRKASWVKLGGLNRQKQVLDIDQAA